MRGKKPISKMTIDGNNMRDICRNLTKHGIYFKEMNQ